MPPFMLLTSVKPAFASWRAAMELRWPERQTTITGVSLSSSLIRFPIEPSGICWEPIRCPEFHSRSVRQSTIWTLAPAWRYRRGLNVDFLDGRTRTKESAQEIPYVTVLSISRSTGRPAASQASIPPSSWTIRSTPRDCSMLAATRERYPEAQASMTNCVVFHVDGGTGGNVSGERVARMLDMPGLPFIPTADIESPSRRRTISRSC